MFENSFSTLLIFYLIGFWITAFILGYKWSRNGHSVFHYNPDKPKKCFLWPIFVIIEILDFPYQVGAWIGKKVRTKKEFKK